MTDLELETGWECAHALAASDLRRRVRTGRSWWGIVAKEVRQSYKWRCPGVPLPGPRSDLAAAVVTLFPGNGRTRSWLRARWEL